jgi:hypothetical protein
VTSNNLRQVGMLLNTWALAGDRFPTNFHGLGPSVNSSLFVVPGLSTNPGPIARIEDWTDYIYLGNLMAGPSFDVAMVISPPENHGGDYGFVLYAGGVVKCLPAEAVRKLIKDPFCIDAKRDPGHAANERLACVMNVPQRLKGYYAAEMIFPDTTVLVMSAVWVNLRETAHGAFLPFARTLEQTLIDGGLTVRAAKGSRLGQLASVDNYIYIGGMEAYMQNAPVLISPPENHGGTNGYVLFADATISQLPPEEVRRLIRDPLGALSEPPDTLVRLRDSMQVNIPRRFEATYGPSQKEQPKGR